MSDTATEETRSGRGRPRAEHTINRDEQVIEALRKSEGGTLTRNEIAEQLGVSPGIAYLSLYRLKNDKNGPRVERAEEGRFSWRLTDVPANKA